MAVCCEKANVLAEQAMKEWLAADEEQWKLRSPLMGKIVSLTSAQLNEIEEANERYSRAADNAVEAMKAALAASLQHRHSN